MGPQRRRRQHRRAAIQIIGLIVIWLAADRPELVCMFYLVFLVIAGIGAALFMDKPRSSDIERQSDGRLPQYRDTWIIGILYGHLRLVHRFRFRSPRC